jgi:phospholipase C
MPRNCAPFDTPPYAVRHNPPPYYKDIAATCKTKNVPLGTPTSGALASALANGTLPSFSFVTPNLCNDTHDCPVKTGDTWLKSWLPTIVDSPIYRAGKTAVFITWDEGKGGTHGQNCVTSSDQTCHIATYVVGPAVTKGARVATRYTHYAMLKTTSQMLGLTTYLGNAAKAKSMRVNFRL